MFLEQASMERLARFSARSTKAKTSVVEERDTTNPALIAQMLMPLLEALGSSFDTFRLRKHVRDDVCIHEAALPWRRAPFWLVLRVATQRQLCLTLGNGTGRACYKFLICTMLTQLLEDSSYQLAPDLVITLRGKLCRRLAKLEMDGTCVPNSVSTIYRHLFTVVAPLSRASIAKATEHVEKIWASFKTKTMRTIPELPIRADENALRLSLRNSGAYLKDLLSMPRMICNGRAPSNISSVTSNAIERRVVHFNEVCFQLSRLEIAAEAVKRNVPVSNAECEAHCIELARLITNLLAAVGDTYESNPEQMSIFILNVFDLWVIMDKCVVKICHLLADYHPVFNPELLDVLQLPRLSEMQRLQGIQNYLEHRRLHCVLNTKNIFSEPDEDCFAARYLSTEDGALHRLQMIQTASAKSRKKKTREWEQASEKYEDLSEKISNGTCVCTINTDGTRNVRGCEKCWHCRCRKRMKISAHEDFLPADAAHQAAVVFELNIPTFFSAYRNVTWEIMSNLAHPGRPSDSSPSRMLLKEYPPLENYMLSTSSYVSLASKKKSFDQTHFKFSKVKAGLLNVLLPLGLQFSYYDMKSKTWLKDLNMVLTFQHLCGVHIPHSLQSLAIESSAHSAHPAPNIDGPSSYEIIANQTRCPPDTSIHEFMAYQRLLSGKDRRWLTMLVELGASNLNFSTEDTMLLFSQLSVQAGPSKNEPSFLRDVHIIFHDKTFCQRLVEQIEARLFNIKSNWRETTCMEMLITLILRLFTLTTDNMRQIALKLLHRARDATLDWIVHLRDEVRGASEASAAERAANYGFWAALLCRRTFAFFMEETLPMAPKDLVSFVRASIALQENLVVDLSRMTRDLRNMLVRDMKMAYRMRTLIRQSIVSDPYSLGAGIDESWSESGHSIGRKYSTWEFLPNTNEGWIVSTITSVTDRLGDSQILHYNFVEGHVLIDGKPLGKLPIDIRESDAVKELFGNQHLLTFPSSLSGMSHVLVASHYRQQIHFGLRGMRVVVQAVTRDTTLEYIPRHIFREDDGFDLPSTLVDGCVHWLDLRRKFLIIRRKPHIWRTRQKDWILDVMHHSAKRGGVLLVDPRSELFSRISGIFHGFEDPQHLTVFQPLSIKGSLSVELKRLALSFHVIAGGLLQCRELRAVIDPNQDAGTWYGFESKIVLRDLYNVDQRSIITAQGELVYRRRGIHVSIWAHCTDKYGRFEIDQVLGRLTCPPEPLLIYSKALFHAITSFVLPDPLTDRTGTEEALHILRSGSSQPWTPISAAPASVLKVLGQ